MGDFRTGMPGGEDEAASGAADRTAGPTARQATGVEARYYDGRIARPRPVRVVLGDRSLVLNGETGAALAHWPLDALVALSDRGDSTQSYAPGHGADERLVVAEEGLQEALRRRCPRLYRRAADTRHARRAVLWGAGALVSVAMIVLVALPMLAVQLAALLPPERARALGDAVVEQMTALSAFSGEGRTAYCTAPRGTRALERMTARLEAAVDLPYPLRTVVIDHPMLNAFAAPGGRVVLTRRLIEGAASPEEVVGVLAHEIGHVVHRDPTVGVLRAAGTAGILSLVVGDVFGVAAIVAASEAVLSASYQREAEARADETGLRILREAGLPTDPLAGFFTRLARQYGASQGVLDYLSSHPALGTRAERAAAADDGLANTFRPALSDGEWLALRTICTERTDRLPAS